MIIEIKAFGRKESASICQAVGEVRLRADSEHDAKVLASLGKLVEHQHMMCALLVISTALIDGTISTDDRAALVEIITRYSMASSKEGE